MRINIIEYDDIAETGRFNSETPVKPGFYDIESVDSGSLAQNKTYWSLLNEYFVSGCFSYPAPSVDELHKHVKKSLGAGFESYTYIEDTGDGIVKGTVATRAEVPKNLAVDKFGQRMLYGNLKSWSAYTKVQRTETIQRLIAEMIASGVNSKKFEQILETLEQNSLARSA